MERLWYRHSVVAYLLLPLTACFFLLALFRRAAYRAGIFKIRYLDKPVVIVGNITVGGTGKTPLVAWLAEYLQAKGFRPGIIARGYGGKARYWPQQVRPDSDPRSVGDEAIMLARKTGCPMAVGPDRYQAGKALLDNTSCDILLADDGLQHYSLGRDLEIAVIDGQRRFGNGWLLPAGPLRESPRRLQWVDLVVSNGPATFEECQMKLRHTDLVSLQDGQQQPLAALAGQQVHAIAGIGNNRRFFNLLKDNGLKLIEHDFADHHQFRAEDVQFADELPVIMTEKDAVKCETFCSGAGYWFLPVKAQPDACFVQGFYELLEEINNGQ